MFIHWPVPPGWTLRLSRLRYLNIRLVRPGVDGVLAYPGGFGAFRLKIELASFREPSPVGLCRRVQVPRRGEWD